MPLYTTHYFAGEEGAEAWEDVVADSRPIREDWENSQSVSSLITAAEHLPNFRDVGVELVELEEGGEEILLMDDSPAVAESLPKHMKAQAANDLLVEETSEDEAFSPESLQRYGFEALVSEIRRTVRQEVESELGGQNRQAPVSPPAPESVPQPEVTPQPEVVPTTAFPASEDWFAPAPIPAPAQDDWFAPGKEVAGDDWFAPVKEPSESSLDSMFDKLFKDLPTPQAELQTQPEPAPQPEPDLPPAWEPALPEEPEEAVSVSEEKAEEEPLPLVFEVTLEQLMAMQD